MPPRSPGPAENRLNWAVVGGTFLLALAVRSGLILSFPTIHGGDAAARLANPETLLLGYQLPFPQAFVVVGRHLFDDPMVVRMVFGFWGAVLAAGGVALLGLIGPPKAGALGALLLATDPLLVHYSIVPYQEAVAYGLLAWAFYLTGIGWPMAASLLMAGACLSRFEAWLFLPAFALASRAWLASSLAGAPAAVWMCWWQGLAPAGLYVLDIDTQADRFSRLAFLGGKWLEYATPVTLVLALLGLLLAWRDRDRRVGWVATFVSLVIGAVVTFGHEFPAGSGRMSERLIHLPVLLSLLLAAGFLGRIASQSRTAFYACLLVALLLAGRNIRFETQLLRAAEREPDLALAREIARAIEKHWTPGECVRVLAPGPDPAALEAFVLKVEASFGDVSEARARARDAANASPDRDRIAAHLTAPPGTVRASSESSCGLTVDVDPTAEPRPALGQPPPLETIRAGSRWARLVRIRS